MCHLNTRFLYNEIPLYILGSIYERFLGKVVHATPQRINVEEKQEVRKSGGVFYTPQYVVDYIVQNTIGPLVEGKTPEEICAMRFADIACGSGSFLIGAYEYLLDYHNNYYYYHPAEAERDGCRRTPEGLWTLSIQQKKNILLNNIYGVDIDAQAVEVTQLSLSLKLLEDETTATTYEMHKVLREKILPDMSRNIVCGNSLVKRDILHESKLSHKEALHINACDLEYVFYDVTRKGGFDAIVGNPPYVSIRTLAESMPEVERTYLSKHYQTAFKGYDLYVCFFERAVGLLRHSGRLGFITPNKYCTLDYGEKLRELMLCHHSLEKLADVSKLNVFEGASVYPYITILKKGFEANNYVKIIVCNTANDLTQKAEKSILQSAFLSQKGYNISLHRLDMPQVKCEKCLKDVCKVQAGTTGFMASKTKDCIVDKAKRGIDFIVTGSVDRYLIQKGNVKYMNDVYAMPKLIYDPAVITKGKWSLYSSPKIVIGGMTKRIEAAYDANGIAVGVGLYCLTEFTIHPFFILGILNSQFATSFFRQEFEAKHLAQDYLAINVGQLEQIPIPNVNETNKERCNQLVYLVEQMQLLQQQHATAKGHIQDKCATDIAATDKQIDEIVYGLYGLTEKDIDVICDVRRETCDNPQSSTINSCNS
jgi:methylase of polypeptide subunit release factors